MPKKILFTLISLLLISPAIVPVFSIFTAEETRVCGVDNNNYPNAREAGKSGIEVSYNFPCEFHESEEDLFERKEYFEFTGMLLDFFADADSAQLLIKDNFDNQTYFATSDTFNNTELEQYLPGDQLKIHATINKNIKTLAINSLSNLSLEANHQKTINCQIIPTEHSSNIIGCIDNDEVLNLSYDINSRFVVGLKNPAIASDLELGDYVRVRIDGNKKIKTLILTERGNLKYLKNHIFEQEAKLVSVNTEGCRDRALPCSLEHLELKVSNYPDSISDINFDKNNLNIKLKINEDTRIVKKYFGKLNLENFKTGDDLYIVGRANDNGSFEAITIKNNSVWR